MGGVVVGLVLGVGLVVAVVFGVVLPLQRSGDDSRARAQVLALKAAAAGGQLAGGPPAAPVESVYDELPPAARRVLARRLDELPPTDAAREAYEAPHPGVRMPRQAPAERPAWEGW